MPRVEDLPRTIQRSPPKAQRTFLKTLTHAERQYGEGERARRTAFAALKRTFEKVGDHWEPKARPGPSDPRSTKSTAQKRAGEGETFGGVDAFGHTRDELLARARALGIRGRSRLSKVELARAIARAQ